MTLTGGVLRADAPPKSGTEVNADGEKALRKRALELNNVTGSDPVKGEIRALLKDETGTKRLLAVALKMSKEKEQPFNVTATYILAVTAHLLKDVDTAQAFYRLNLDQEIKLASGSKINQAFSNLIELLLSNKRYAECEKVCTEFLEIEGDDTIENLKPTVLRRKILVMARQDHYDKANEMLDKLIKIQPDNWLNVILKGDLLREEGKNTEAAKIFEDVTAKVKDDKRLTKEMKEDFTIDLQYRLSGVYVDLDQVDKAAEQLNALLEKEPNNPTFNNDLGYIWADHDKNLEKSEKLIRKAIDEDRKLRHKDADLKPEQDKDNPAFLDSLGWVLFKQKKFKEAKEPLLDAVKAEEGKHIEIYDHLGDVFMALGEKSEAVEAWKKGVAAAGKSAREQQRKVIVEKKLQDTK
jgi:predicted Zn-dependent protease